jgi:FkbM family methyltransferase
MEIPFYRTLENCKGNIRKIVYKISLTVMLYIFSPSLLKRTLEHSLTKHLSESAVREVNDYKMLLSLNDRGIHRALFLRGKREQATTDYFLNDGVVKEGDLVLDIGANIGYYALMESNLVGSTGKVYAVEPVSTNLKTLLENIRLNGCKNIEVFHLAFGDKKGRAIIYISDHANLCSIKKNPNLTYKREEEVEISTVDSFLNGRKTPNLIRMDVEGYEYNIIKGMKETLKKDVKLLIEVHGFLMTKEQLNEIFRILKQNHFKVKFAIVEAKRINRLADHVRKKIYPDVPIHPKILPPTKDMERIREFVIKNRENGLCVEILFSKSIMENIED